MGEFDLAELDADDDELGLEPTAGDVATMLRIGVDPEQDRAALGELADAMLVWAGGRRVRRLAERAASALWNDELDGLVRDGLEQVAGKGPEWATVVPELRAGLERDGPRSELARAIVEDLAMQLSSHDQPVFFCTCCLDEGIVHAPEAGREIALQIAVVGCRDVTISAGELTAALAGLATRAPTEALATDERRQAVRSRLGRLGDLGRGSVPALAAELRAIAAEPLPSRVEDDDVWQTLCDHLLAEFGRPELN